MPYSLTRDDLASISDAEFAFSTHRLLPAMEDIPKEFFLGNIYTRLATAMFHQRPLPDGEVYFLSGFEDGKVTEDLDKCVSAHLRSFWPKHQHKIAGVGFMIAQVCRIEARPEVPSGPLN